MAYAPRRRGAGKEVQAFATAFAQGMKLFSDDDRGGRARSRDPYSDDNIAKRDERLGSTSALGKFFGMGKDELTGFDRGRAAIEEKMRIAAERGDATAYERFAKERVLLEKQAANPAVGETYNQSPFENRAAKPSDTDVPIPIPRPGPGASLDAGGQDTVASGGGENDFVAYNDPTGGSADWSNMFSGENSIFSARGGMVPMLHAARGMSVPSRTGDTYQYGYVEDPNDQGFGETAIPAPAPTEPTDGPAIEDDGRTEQTGNLGLSRDPEELASAAAPAIAAGMDRIQSELKPSGAISAQDPAYQDKLQKFARGEGRMSDEEISQMDAAIDPDGTMSPGSRSAARVAAIYKFYQDKGDPQTAQDMAARVVLYDKFASQTRGAMALQAFKDGDTESGVRLLEDAYNNNMPDGKTLKTKINKDGTVDFQIGWDKLTGFKTSQEGKATQQDLIQLASNTATGTEQMQRFMQAAGASKGGGTGRGGVAATNRAASASAAEGFNTALGEVDAAAKAVATARTGGDPDAIKAADDALRAARTKAMSGARSVNEQKQRDTMVGATIARAISASGTAPARTGGATGGTQADRDAAAQAARVAELDVRERGALADIAPGRFQDESERERAVGRLQDTRLARTDITAGREPKRAAFSKDVEERQEPIKTALDAFMKEGKAEAASGKIDVTSIPKLEGNKRRQFIDTVDMAMARNDISPDTAVIAMYDAIYKTNVTPQLVGDGKGGAVLSIGDERLVVDRDLYRRIASLRGAEISAARIGTNKALKERQDRAEEARVQAIGSAADREQAATGRVMTKLDSMAEQERFERGIRQATPRTILVPKPPTLRGPVAFPRGR
jgi:hypothetical protein